MKALLSQLPSTFLVSGSGALATSGTAGSLISSVPAFGASAHDSATFRITSSGSGTVAAVSFLVLLALLRTASKFCICIYLLSFDGFFDKPSLIDMIVNFRLVDKLLTTQYAVNI